MESIFAGLGDDDDELQRIFDDYKEEGRQEAAPSLQSSASKRREVTFPVYSKQPLKGER